MNELIQFLRLSYSCFIICITCLQLLLYGGCVSNGQKAATEIVDESDNIKRDTIILVNTTNKELGFFYDNKFLDLERFHLKAFDTVRLYADVRQLITQTNNNQNFYIFYPGDTLYASASSNGDAIFMVRGDSVRNNELNLQWKINDGTPLNFMKILLLRGRYFDKDYEKLDSVYRSDFNSKINFINQYKMIHPISAKYEMALKNYYKSLLFGSELWLGATTKATIHRTYTEYLNSLKDSIDALGSISENSLDPFLQFTYVRYQLKEMAGNKFYDDSLYAHYRKINNIEKNIKQLVLFKIVKESLEKNPVEKCFVKDFIENTVNKEYKVYIEDLMKNNFLMLSASNKNSIINQVNRVFSYDSLIKSLKGNVIYIDVWASWCGPCRAEMPSSMTIKTSYKNKNIRFVYLSIDDNISAWKTANKEVGLEDYSYSYLLLNAQKSDFIKQFKLGGIPRYILINEQGHIDNANALRPSDERITKIFDSMVDK